MEATGPAQVPWKVTSPVPVSRAWTVPAGPAKSSVSALAPVLMSSAAARVSVRVGLVIMVVLLFVVSIGMIVTEALLPSI
jgi:hypothetical protein